MPAKRTGKTVKPLLDLVPGVAVVLADGGEAILVRAEAGEAFLRCGTAHRSPIRRAADQISPVAPADETLRHAKFRREAVARGEIELSERDRAH
jgi:hypothetical protein